MRLLAINKTGVPRGYSHPLFARIMSQMKVLAHSFGEYRDNETIVECSCAGRLGYRKQGIGVVVVILCFSYCK